jgi:hypothetical protein
MLQGDSRALATVLREQVECCVASPPYEASQYEDGRRRDPAHQGLINHRMAERTNPRTPGEKLCLMDYAAQTAEGNIAIASGDTFWSAAATIIAQVVALLKPGGVAVFVVKAYCRDGAIVDFPGQWRTLCESCGLVTLHEHHALLVEEHGTQGGLFGEDTTHRTERKSFFRRLHEKKRPDLAIDFEMVLCMQKPLDTAEGSADLCCASPPYAGAGEVLGQHNGIDWSKTTDGGKSLTPGRAMQPYGHTEGQLGSMREGTLSCVVSSPPYVHSVHDGNGIDQTKLTGNRPGRHTQAKAEGYGTTPRNLGNLPEGHTP